MCRYRGHSRGLGSLYDGEVAGGVADALFTHGGGFFLPLLCTYQTLKGVIAVGLALGMPACADAVGLLTLISCVVKQSAVICIHLPSCLGGYRSISMRGVQGQHGAALRLYVLSVDGCSVEYYRVLVGRVLSGTAKSK